MECRRKSIWININKYQFESRKDAKKFLTIECARQVVRIPFQNEVDIFRSRKERGGEKMRDLKEAVTNEFISNVSVK